ncbi:MAG: hypothetical protein Q4C01_04005 [Clostridia bacterium]|nr:hypothetical protein [Clostridia bacterium]
MVKKLSALVLALCIILSFSLSSANEASQDVLPFELRKAFCHSDFTFAESVAESMNAVAIFNPESCDVLFEKNSDYRFYCDGSMAHMMAVKLALNYLDTETDITCSEEVAAQPYTQSIGLEPNRSYRVLDLIAAMLLYGAQDAAALLLEQTAEASGRCEQADSLENKLNAAVEMMNEEAQRLGMVQTVYTNALGERENDQRTSAEDTVRLMYALYVHESGAYISDAEYLLGCLTRSGLSGEMSASDPRSSASAAYNRDVGGYAFCQINGLSTMALSYATEWRKPGDPLEGRLFIVAASDSEGAELRLNEMVTYVESNFCILNCSAMISVMLEGTQCSHCSGSLATHSVHCPYPVISVTTGDENMLITVDISMYTLLTELYSSNRYSTFEAVIDDTTVASMDVIPLGDYFATATIYFQEREMIAAELFVSDEEAASDQKTLIVSEPIVEEEGGLKIQTVILLAAGLLVIICVVYFIIISRMRRKKY